MKSYDDQYEIWANKNPRDARELEEQLEKESDMSIESTDTEDTSKNQKKIDTSFSCLRRGIVGVLLATLFSCGAAERQDLVDSLKKPSHTPAPVVMPTATPEPITTNSQGATVTQDGNGNTSVVVNNNVENTPQVTEVRVTKAVDLTASCNVNYNNGKVVSWVLEQRAFAQGHWFKNSEFGTLNEARMKRQDFASNGLEFEDFRIDARMESGCLMTDLM